MKTALLYRAESMPVTVAVGPVNTGQSAELAEPGRTIVRFDDLNLAYDLDVRVLYRRIRVAAATYSPNTAKSGVATVDSIVAATVTAIEHPRLSEHHRRMTS